MGINNIDATLLGLTAVMTAGCASAEPKRPPIVAPVATAVNKPIDFRINAQPMASAVDSQKIIGTLETPISVWESQFGKGNVKVNLYTIPSADGYAFEMEDATGARYAYVAWGRDVTGVVTKLPENAEGDKQADGSLMAYSVTNNVLVAGYTDMKDGVKGYLYPQLGAFIYLDKVPLEKEETVKQSVFGFGDILAEFVRKETIKAGEIPTKFALHPNIDTNGNITWKMIVNKGGKTYVINKFP